MSRFEISHLNKPNFKHKFEESPDEKLNKNLSTIADNINREYCQPGEKKLVLDDGSINKESFDYFDPEKDPALVKKIEISNSGIDRESVREFYSEKVREKNRLPKEAEITEEELIKYWKTEQEKQISFRWEKAAVILLSRILSSDFIVVRGSDLDDYTNKTDTVIVDKESGAVICAIDLVNDKAGGDRYEKKLSQLKKDAEKSRGGELRFGITMETDEKTGQKKLVKKRLTNVPRFFLPVERDDLDKLLSQMPNDFNVPPIEIEKSIFGKLVEALGTQEEIYLSNAKESSPVEKSFKGNLEKFQESLEKMKKIKENF